jgi:hypothetical protein
MLSIIGQRIFKDDLGTWYGNICLTNDNKLVTYRGIGYHEFNTKTGKINDKIISIN